MLEKTIIFGSGITAKQVAGELAHDGGQVTIVSGTSAIAEFQDADVAAPAECLACRRTESGFEITCSVDGKRQVFSADRLVVAEEADREPNFGRYGLTAGERVLSLSDRIREAADRVDAGGAQQRVLVLISGLAAESRPATARTVMELALEYQTAANWQTFVFTGNLKVAGDGLEALSMACKRAGTVFARFADTLPDIRQAPDGSVSIAYVDDLTREACILRPDLTVVDEDIVPSARLASLARVLEIETDVSGFAQADNVHRLVTGTNRKGILVAGASRDFIDPRKTSVEAACSAVSVGADAGPDLERADIDRGRCVRCLTCYRLCPYRAVALDRRVTVTGDLCEGCGICTAECPAVAIRIPGLSSEALLAPHERVLQGGNGADPDVRIIAYCCTRSAAPAADLAAAMGYRLPANLVVVAVPCTGGVSVDHLLSAFLKGADGVLVLTCHEGNCHSTRGNVLAGQRVDNLKGILGTAGVEAGRLAIASLASNMGREFADTVDRFNQEIQRLGRAKFAPSGR